MKHPRIWAVIAFLFLFLSFGFNAFGFAPEWRLHYFQSDSQAYTLGKIADITRDPLSAEALLSTGCRPAEDSLKDSIDKAEQDFPNASCEKIYTGNPAIHAIPLGWLATLGFSADVDGKDVFVGLRLLSAALTALVATWLVLSAKRMYGLSAAIGVFASFMVSFWLIAAAPNLYWFPATLFLPAAFAAHELAKGRSPISFHFIFWLSALLVLRFLSGFEFLTNVMLSVAVIWLVAPRTLQGTPKRILTEGLTGIAACIFATASAIALHVLMTSATIGSLGKSWDVFVRRVLYRTVDMGQELSESLRSSLSVDRFQLILRYLDQPIAFENITLAMVAIFTLLLIGFSRLAGKSIYQPTGLVALSILASISWHALAKGHSSVHFHINHILSTLPAFPILCAIAVDRLSICVKSFAAYRREKR